MQVCGCEKSRKISRIEWPFIIDQRNERMMVMAGVDKVVTKRLENQMQWKAKDLEKISAANNEPVPSTSGASCFDNSPVKSENCDISSETSSDEEFQCPLYKKLKVLETSTKAQMKTFLPYTAKAADLTGASTRSVAKIVNAVLQDFSLISEENPAKVVDKNKIRREVHKNRKRLQESEAANKETLQGLYFDGRKDTTIHQIEGRRVQKQEEHISIIKEPDSIYFGHLALQPPVRSEDIKNNLLQHLTKRGINPKHLVVIGCDGTNVNTGWKGGAIRLMETSIGKPVQWSICLLHSNELPLRHLLQTLDGHTKGPYTYSGLIGSRLQDCENYQLYLLEVFIVNYRN